MLAQQHVQHDPVDAVVGAVERDRPDDGGALPEPVHAALALLVPGRVPGEVVVDDGLEAGLQVHAFRQAVRGDEDGTPGLVLGQVPDPRQALVGRQDAGDRGDRVLLAEAVGELLGDVLGGVDEAAEQDRVVAVEQQLGDDFGQQGDLGVACPLQPFGPAGEALEPPAVCRVALRGLAVRTRGGIGGLDGLLVGEVKHGRAAEPVRFRDIRGVDVGGPGAQGGGGGPRRGRQRPQQRQRRPVPDPLPELAAVGIADGLAGVLQHVGEQFLVIPGQQVGPFLAQPVLREGRRLPGIGADVTASALHEVAGEPLPSLDRFKVDRSQARLQQRQQVAEPFLLAAVRGRGDQDQVPGGLLG